MFANEKVLLKISYDIIKSFLKFDFSNVLLEPVLPKGGNLAKYPFTLTIACFSPDSKGFPRMYFITLHKVLKNKFKNKF